MFVMVSMSSFGQKATVHMHLHVIILLLQLYPGGGGGLPYEDDGDAPRKIRIIPLKETNLGMVQVLFDP